MTYLEERIGSDSRYEHVTVLTIYGGLSEQRRREIFRDFERAKVAVLVATDAISEGINLQHAAAQVIHYELPWNPNRLEQRNGRVDRFGQRKPVVTIRTMVMDETLDAAILKVLVEKAARIRSDYGFSPPYFGDETTILDLLKEHDVRLGPRQLSLFDSAGPSLLDVAGEPAEDPFARETLERIKGDSFYGQTHISLPEMAPTRCRPTRSRRSTPPYPTRSSAPSWWPSTSTSGRSVVFSLPPRRAMGLPIGWCSMRPPSVAAVCWPRWRSQGG
jgi:hypothetical protein